MYFSAAEAIYFPVIRRSSVVSPVMSVGAIREFEFYEFFSFLKFNEFYEFFSVEENS